LAFADATAGLRPPLLTACVHRRKTHSPASAIITHHGGLTPAAPGSAIRYSPSSSWADRPGRYRCALPSAPRRVRLTIVSAKVSASLELFLPVCAS